MNKSATFAVIYYLNNVNPDYESKCKVKHVAAAELYNTICIAFDYLLIYLNP